MEREALKLALEALENAIAVRHGKGGTKFVDPLEPNAITAIKAALAQPAQKLDYKVALNEWLDKTEWVQEKINSGHLGARYLGMHRADVLRDLAYQNTVTGKAPAQPADNPYGYDWSMLEAAQESLREHMARIKELEAQLAQPAQKHVAVVEFEPVIQGHEVWFPARCIASEIPTGTKLYTTPPQRTWVGLTEEEIDVIEAATWDEDHKSWGIHDFAKAIEAKLKERNHGA